MRSHWWGIIFLFLALVSFFVARQWSSLFPDAVTLQSEANCDIAAGPCRSSLPDGGSLQLSITPVPIPLMQPLQVEVKVQNSQLTPLQLDITGLNMEMGLNRTRLEPGAPGHWSGETILPICSQRRMHWQAALLLGDGTRQFRMAYPFYTLRP